MSHERILVQVEAMLALRRFAEVLRLLDAMPLTDIRRARALLLTRAELRARAGRCADGIRDFDLVLSRADRADERGLYGRAVCRLRTGDSVGAQRDFEQYLELFPRGPHSGEVRRHLDE
jgi:Flp pilus assembly protein TadD